MTDDFVLIHRYTRAEAIEDGVLIEVTPTGFEAGFKLSLCLTSGAWVECVTWTRKGKGLGQDEHGRLWDVITQAARAARMPRNRDLDRVPFTVLRIPNEGQGRTPRPVQLVLHIGPGDNAEPVLTIMLPNED